ncbi:hypothetical protein ACSA002_2000 [Salmonella phage vB_SalM_SA002]|nr:hypothetical protein ACSA002_2000 [Salmonella phage vB_SalM_SA002]
MKEQENIYFEALSLTAFDAFKEQHNVEQWMHIRIPDLALRGKDSRFSDTGKLIFKTSYTDNHGANRTYIYNPGIDLGLVPNDDGLYDLSGIYVELMWSPNFGSFLVFINIPHQGALVYRGITDHAAKKPNGMSVCITRVTEVA